jgi:hypothetical protein
MTRRRGVAYILMLGAIAKHFLSSEYGPWDRLIELGVFVLIAYEVIVGIVRHRKEKKRQARLAAISSKLCALMDEGQKIREAAVPQWHEQTEWMNAMRDWSERTSGYLSALSPSAAAAFGLVVDSPPNTTRAVRMKKGGGFNIAGPLLELYYSHSVQLNNLRGIIEKPEAYFE